jgi:hypothetical protein
MLPLNRNYFRSADGLKASLNRLDASWRTVSDHIHGDGAEAVRSREAAALIATSRWAYRSARRGQKAAACTAEATGRAVTRLSIACSRRAGSKASLSSVG